MSTIKKYWVYAGIKFSPTGGAYDFLDSFDSIEEADAKIQELRLGNEFDWYHIVKSDAPDMVITEYD